MVASLIAIVDSVKLVTKLAIRRNDFKIIKNYILRVLFKMIDVNCPERFRSVYDSMGFLLPDRRQMFFTAAMFAIYSHERNMRIPIRPCINLIDGVLIAWPNDISVTTCTIAKFEWKRQLRIFCHDYSGKIISTAGLGGSSTGFL